MLIAIIVIGLIIVLVLIDILIRNSMIGARNRVDEAWSGIDVQLKRRHDLVPNLVETVKGYAQHEQQTFEKRRRRRAPRRWRHRASTEAAPAEQNLTAALANLRAVAENYPQLRATENFQRLQSEPGRDRGRDPGLAPDLQLQRPVLQHEDPGLPELGRRRTRVASPRASSSRSRPPPTASRSRSPSPSPPPAASPRAARARRSARARRTRRPDRLARVDDLEGGPGHVLELVEVLVVPAASVDPVMYQFEPLSATIIP